MASDPGMGRKLVNLESAVTSRCAAADVDEGVVRCGRRYRYTRETNAEVVTEALLQCLCHRKCSVRSERDEPDASGDTAGTEDYLP
jgi:hypothetical protein